MMTFSSYCLRLDGHLECLSTRLLQLQRSEQLTDVTLCCHDSTLHAHRLVLSAYSSYFRRLFSQELTEPHVVFYMFDVSSQDLSALLEFMYRGSVNVRHDRLQRFIKLADSLKIAGISSQRNPTSTATATTESDTTAVSVNNNNINSPDNVTDSRLAAHDDDNSGSIISDIKPARSPALSGVQSADPGSPTDMSDTEPGAEPAQCEGVDQLTLPVEPEAPTVPTTEVIDLDDTPAVVKTESVESEDSVLVAALSESQHTWSSHTQPQSLTAELNSSGVSMVTDFDVSSFPSLSSMVSSPSLPPLFPWPNTRDTPQVPPSSCPPSYRCPECDKCYTLRSSLLEHLPLHSGLTRCPVCSKVSSTVSHLRKHLVVAHHMDGVIAKRLVNSMKASTTL